MDDLERLDRDGIARCIERWPHPLRTPRAMEAPADALDALFVEQDDGARLALGRALHGGEVPLPELIRIRDAALERDRAERVEAVQLAAERRIVAVAVVDD